MTDEATFLAAILDRPDDWAVRLVFADWLEERGDRRGELLRLLHDLTRPGRVPSRSSRERRLRELTAAGVRSPGPYRTLPRLGMKFALVAPGSVPPPSRDEPDYDEDDIAEAVPPRWSPGGSVEVTAALYVGVYSVTQKQWQDVMGENPSQFADNEARPVESVSWQDCRAFCRRLGERTGKAVRLLTRAEWQYACQAGSTTPFHFGYEMTGRHGTCRDRLLVEPGKKLKLPDRPTPVGRFPPNAWGLFDMHGNVWEWCADCWTPRGELRMDDPALDLLDAQAVECCARGGSWETMPERCHAAGVYRGRSDARDATVGLRVCFPAG